MHPGTLRLPKIDNPCWRLTSPLDRVLSAPYSQWPFVLLPAS